MSKAVAVQPMTRSHRPLASGPSSLRSADRQHDEDEDERQQQRVEDLRREHDLDERQARDHDEQRREPDEEGEQAVEGRRLAPVPLDAGLPAERLARRVGARQRHDTEPEERRAEQADGEEHAGGLAGDRLERLGGVRGAGDRRLPGGVQGRGAADDDERRDDVGQERAEEHVDAARRQVLGPEALVHDVGLDERLAPRGDGRPDRADDGQPVHRRRRELRARSCCGTRRSSPGGRGPPRSRRRATRRSRSRRTGTARGRSCRAR